MPNNCSVLGCNNTKRKTAGSGIKYFKFPKEKNHRQQWIQACSRGEVFNVDNAVICSMHFTSSDYKDDLKHRLLGTEAPKSYRPLTDTAVPSLNLPQAGKMMPLSRLVQDVRELYLGKTRPTTPKICNAMSPRVILIRLTQKYIEKKNEPLSDEEEMANEWNMNILEPVVEISDKPKDNSKKRKGRTIQGVSRKKGRPSKVQENNFSDVSIKQEPSDPLPVAVPLEEVSHNVPMATIPMDSNATPPLPLYQVPAGNLAVYVSQPQPLVIQHTVAVQNTDNLLINQPPNVNSPSTSDKSIQDIHSEVDLESNIKQEEQMENVFVVPFGKSLETENKSSSGKQSSTEPDVVECESSDELARRKRRAAIAAIMGGPSHRKLRDLTFKLVELNNKNLKCDNRIEKIKDEFKKRLQVVEIEKKGIEQEIDKVLASIQDWKDAKKQSL
ncbi:uncharacterized protein LOC123501322 isoform X2 [Portunus trituberculatus]|uniref:uncharacterized protein LOC123501322 isoform X2 n=1 Tax=Portunus trituberculatus TaxID=210409 RepID=UPI001E1CBEA6|nr:uncharacterized protein LOC123501322 isoform X2 [Portunus trituberculatus]